ncbi:uncharacterized protein TM35_000401060 [Trypanosoma theileri]|uniref:Uncharacterized protein n=1 Tax=Trypanosoma theileri TaxID=67003 RepID=A0A1X0NL12_9TRYP|nr:uncharacterized protein TM35_000401060 [Trypanosoma theileri]ORC84839.1 hypothetical protein TM35_000401060 [Trypanosoma theileri]
MSGSAIPVRVLGRHVLDLWVFEVNGTADLDFVLCDVAASERDRLGDYTWLDDSTRPQFRRNDDVSSRVGALVHWIERCYTKKCTSELSNVLRVYNNLLAFEYEAFLSNIGADGGRRVEGFVQPTGSGAHITLNIPLQLKDEVSTRQTLSNIIECYAKILNQRLDAVPHFSSLELSLIIACETTGGDAAFEVLSEHIVMHVEDIESLHKADFTPFIRSCINFGGLPQYSATLQQRGTFMDYIQQFETVLKHSINELKHFLDMVSKMSSFFGSPVSVSVSLRDGESTGDINESKRRNSGNSSVVLESDPSLVRLAVFCVVDDVTQFGFSIVMRYRDGWTLPSIEIIANQYSGSTSQESTLRTKLQYPEEMRRLEKKRGVDTLVDIAAFCDAVRRVSFETMSFLISTCQ